MIKGIDVLEINQPIGTFYIGKINSNDLLKITKVDRRLQNKDGIQRELSHNRVKEIAAYCEDPDATFPTPIILSVESSDKQKLVFDSQLRFEYDDSFEFAEILDGQHRIAGIRENGNIQLDLVVIIMFDLTQEQKAYVFSTINSNQVKVDKSLIFDLFELSENRSPYKTCHDLARIFNSNLESPFYKRLKMLGKKASSAESLSQGTFVTYLVKLISRDPKDDAIKIKKGWRLEDDPYLPLRNIFIAGNDEIILKILLNYFKAAKSVFPEEWDNPEEYILTKTTGFGALVKAFKHFYAFGLENKTLTYQYFCEQLQKSKKTLCDNGLKLNSECFPSNEHQQQQLMKYFIKHLEK